jgi:hypothetical protein
MDCIGHFFHWVLWIALAIFSTGFYGLQWPFFPLGSMDCIGYFFHWVLWIKWPFFSSNVSLDSDKKVGAKKLLFLAGFWNLYDFQTLFSI